MKDVSLYSGRKSVRKLGLSDVHLNPAPSPGGEYHPVVPRSVMAKLFRRINGDFQIPGFGLTFSAFTGVVGLGLLHSSVLETLGVSSQFEIAAALAVSTAVSLPVAHRIFFNKNSSVVQAWNRLNKANEVAFSVWLKDRYGVEVLNVDDEDKRQWAVAAAGLPWAKDHVFEAVDGRKFQVRQSDEGNSESGVYIVYLQDDRPVIEDDRPLKMIEGDNLFTGDAAALWSSLQERLKTVESDVASSSELAHAIGRVKQDMEAVVHSYRSYTDLKTREGEPVKVMVTSILSDLNDEVQAMIDAEAAGLEKDIRTQMEWVRNRRNIKSSALILEGNSAKLVS